MYTGLKIDVKWKKPSSSKRTIFAIKILKAGDFLSEMELQIPGERRGMQNMWYGINLPYTV